MQKTMLSLIATLTILGSVFSIPVLAQVEPDDGFMGSPMGMEHNAPPPEHNGKGKMGECKKGGGHFLEMMKDLNLTEDQKQKLKSQRAAAQSQMKSLRKQLMDEHKKMAEVMFAPNSTKAEMVAQHQKIMAVQNQLAMLRINNIATFKEILTPEQKAKLQKISEQKMKNFEAKRKSFEARKGNPDKN